MKIIPNLRVLSRNISSTDKSCISFKLIAFCIQNSSKQNFIYDKHLNGFCCTEFDCSVAWFWSYNLFRIAAITPYREPLLLFTFCWLSLIHTTLAERRIKNHNRFALIFFFMLSLLLASFMSLTNYSCSLYIQIIYNLQLLLIFSTFTTGACLCAS